MLGTLLMALWRLVVALAPSLLSQRWRHGPPHRSWAKVHVEPRPLVLILPACQIATSVPLVWAYSRPLEVQMEDLMEVLVLVLVLEQEVLDDVHKVVEGMDPLGGE